MSPLMIGLALTLSSASAPQADAFRLIHPPDLAAMQADKAHPLYLFDANKDDFRAKEGVIPGAVLLKASDYEVATTLPQDKASSLVFYCANTKCMASHGAAKRAVQAGYTNVAVLADGLLGWKAAGNPTSKP